MTHLHLLLLLQAEGPLAMSRLAGALDVSVSSATGIVDRMAERGLIERERDERDRRLVLVRLAPAGQAAVEEADLVRRQHLVDVMRRLSPRQQQDVLQALHDLRSVLDTGLPESTTPGEGR
ncbi:MAG TPA: MarR family transcriptional regulator [Candidatus Limnocylindrales bacterium]|nr:MarR family transcriptional regulator [Candidatus Limnocylindrales bacterium]